MTQIKTKNSISKSSPSMRGTHSFAPDGETSSERKPSPPQRQWLLKGLKQPGGKLPIFLDDGRQVCERTVKTCLERGWAEPWFANPIKPNWQICRLTEKGRLAVLGLKD